MVQKFPAGIVKEFGVFNVLRAPSQVQDFLDSIPINFEEGRETCRSPLMVLRHKKAHCMEGAMLAAAAFWHQGARPLLLDLKTTNDDFDHVVAPFRVHGRWGAVSKTNHAVLRYRDPVYASVRELAMSYFHEYFLDSGVKTLRSYSAPFDLAQLGGSWLTSKKNLWDIGKALDDSPHFKIFDPKVAHTLRLAHPVEREAGELVEWKKSGA